MFNLDLADFTAFDQADAGDGSGAAEAGEDFDWEGVAHCLSVSVSAKEKPI
jgi:hypothetical protein